MNNNPYKSFDSHAFWKTGVEKCDITSPEKIYTPKWKISDTDKIATMGSCFAQHIAKWLRENGFNVPFYDEILDKSEEPTFSANYGNVYTVRQALQLVEESMGIRVPSEIAWHDGTKFIDALRPNTIKRGFKTDVEVVDARKSHLTAIHHMVMDLDVLVFTLGLTEAWEIKRCGTILPTAPGVIGGTFDPDKYEFVNFRYDEIMEDLYSLCDLIYKMRGGRSFKLLLTVSPVPLTATASNQHVLMATSYSKAVLRTAADDFVTDNDFVEYFPSFEIINNPAARGEFFESNLRSVKTSAVRNVMTIFSTSALENPRMKLDTKNDEAFDPDCEDALLEEFSTKHNRVQEYGDIVCVGNSHLVGLRQAISNDVTLDAPPHFFPVHWGKYVWSDFHNNDYLTRFSVKPEYEHLVEPFTVTKPGTLIISGLCFSGDNIARCHGPMYPDASPKLPIALSVTPKLVRFYESYIQRQMPTIHKIDENAPYNRIFWVVGPDMCVDVAKHRFGEKFVNSGSYIFHKEAYMLALNKGLTNIKNIKFIFHDNSLTDPLTGFTMNKYRSSVSPLDIHCNAEYYKGIVNEII